MGRPHPRSRPALDPWRWVGCSPAVERWRFRAAESARDLGEHYLEADDPERAREAFNKCLDAAPAGPYSDRVRAALERLGPAAGD